MLRRSVLAMLLLVAFHVPARGGILLFLDDIDDHRFVNEVTSAEAVKAQGRVLKQLADEVLRFERPAIEKWLGAPAIKPPKAFAMPLAEQRGIGLSGLRRTDDDRPDEHFICFHPIGDYAAIEVYYGRTASGNEPIAVRIYLRVDKNFVRLNRDNFDERLAWEWERIAKLEKFLDKKPK